MRTPALAALLLMLGLSRARGELNPLRPAEHSKLQEPSPQPTPEVLPQDTKRRSPTWLDPVGKVANSFLSVFIHNPDLLRVATKSISGLFYLNIVLSVLGTAGVDIKAVLSILSISGLTLGLSIQTILGQAFAGFFLVLFCPFKRGWTITVDNFTGKVVSIDVRYVRLLLKNRSEVLLPSHQVYTKSIIVENRNGE